MSYRMHKMSGGPYTFGPFRLDLAERRLTRDGEPLDVGGRYLDALALLAAESGRLVTKDRFMDEVWHGVPVTDEALTQCIRSLRKALGDNAAAPQMIETIPRHGYRLIVPVEASPTTVLASSRRASAGLPIGIDTLSAGTGGALAGIVGGLGYLSLGLDAPEIGTASTLLVLVSVNLLVGFAGAAAIGFGIGIAHQLRPAQIFPAAAGGAIGGLLVGAIGHMVGNDLFALFFGHVPAASTGAAEGLALGGATGVASALAMRFHAGSIFGRVAPGFVLGGLGGLGIALAGGRLMTGSLAELAARFPDSRLRLDGLGGWLGEAGFGPNALTIATTLEGALFSGAVVSALATARRLRG